MLGRFHRLELARDDRLLIFRGHHPMPRALPMATGHAQNQPRSFRLPEIDGFGAYLLYADRLPIIKLPDGHTFSPIYWGENARIGSHRQ